MIFRTAGLAFALFISGCVAAPTAAIAPPVLLDIYKDADAYQSTAMSRLCADPSLTSRLEASKARMAAAKAALVARYGTVQVEAAQVAVVSITGSLCSDKAAAANAVELFEKAVSDLEAALQ